MKKITMLFGAFAIAGIMFTSFGGSNFEEVAANDTNTGEVKTPEANGSKPTTEGTEGAEEVKPSNNWKSISEGLSQTDRKNKSYNISDSKIEKTPVPHKKYALNAYSFGKKEKKVLITDLPVEELTPVEDSFEGETYDQNGNLIDSNGNPIDSSTVNGYVDPYNTENQSQGYSAEEGMNLDNQYNGQNE